LRPGAGAPSSPPCPGPRLRPELERAPGPWPHGSAPPPPVFAPRLLRGPGPEITPRLSLEGGSPSCCAVAPGSTNRTTAAPPSGTATTRTTTTPTTAFDPAVSSPQHPSPSEPLEGIPAGVQEGSRPAPVIGDPRWQGLPRANGRTIRTTPAHCPTAPDLGCLVGFCWALTPTTAPPRHGQPAAPAPSAPPRCAPPSGSGLRGRQSDRAATDVPSGDQRPLDLARCRWREGKPWGNREGQRPWAPTGHPPPKPIRFPCSFSAKAAQAL
jgi:hypothetical protein